MSKKAEIFYFALPELWKKEEKLKWFGSTQFKNIPFERITPDKNHNWIHLAEDNDWDSLLPICSKNTKAQKVQDTLFEFYSNGIVTARDEWVYDRNCSNLGDKIEYFFSEYNAFLEQWKIELKDKKLDTLSPDELLEYSNQFVFRLNPKTKWSSRLRRDKLLKNRIAFFEPRNIKISLYRPFFKTYLYIDYMSLDIVGRLHEVFPAECKENRVIITSGNPHNKPFQVIGSDISYDFGTLETTQGFPLFIYKNGNRIENITNWGLEQFQTHYQDAKIGKEAIFHYVYAVLHNPAYRQKYELNLKREFPRIPFYPNFWQWAAWGKQLMDLHVNYESVTPFQLTIQHNNVKTANPKAKLKADKLTGVIELDEQTSLHGIPTAAWEYKLGNRSALEWILDQYKEKKISDPTIAEKFDNYRFANYKDTVIDLLQRVCTVSVKTVEIVDEMVKDEKNHTDISNIT